VLLSTEILLNYCGEFGRRSTSLNIFHRLLHLSSCAPVHCHHH